MGADRALVLSIVDPALSKYVAEKLQEEAAILKERRTGREEKELAAAASQGRTLHVAPPGQRPPGEQRKLTKAEKNAAKAAGKGASPTPPG